MTEKFLTPQDAKTLKDEINKMRFKEGNSLIVDPYDVFKIIDSHTEQSKQQFEIPVMKIMRYSDGIYTFSITGKNNADIENWHQAIFANAAAMPECRWVTLDHDKQAAFWKQEPKYGTSEVWLWREDILQIQFVHPSLIPEDCSTAIVEIKHI